MQKKTPSGNSLKNGQRIVGMNTENAEINEGLVRFDIIYLCKNSGKTIGECRSFY